MKVVYSIMKMSKSGTISLSIIIEPFLKFIAQTLTETLWFTIGNLPGDFYELGLPSFLFCHKTGRPDNHTKRLCLGSIRREINYLEIHLEFMNNVLVNQQ